LFLLVFTKLRFELQSLICFVGVLVMSVRQWEFPYVFAYDICCDRRRRKVFKCLKQWRVDGQYSIHETWLRQFQMRDLSVELIELIDRKKDSFLVCRLDQRKSAPVYQMMVNPPVKVPVSGKPRPVAVPEHLRGGDYLVCYDIRESRRLQRIQRLTAKCTSYLQRSVYLYRGNGKGLLDLLELVRKEMAGDDDLRIYNLSHVRDMWFLSEEKSVVEEVKSVSSGSNLSFWQRLLSKVFK